MTAEQRSNRQLVNLGGLPQRSQSAGPLAAEDAGQPEEVIYEFLLAVVKAWEPRRVLDQFEQLFVYQVEVADPAVLKAVQGLVKMGDRQKFFYCLKRSCFILINNWGSARIYEPIHTLIELLNSPGIRTFTHSQVLKRLRTWLVDFTTGQEYRDLKVFAERYSDGHGRWSQRYMSYLLVPQYSDSSNPAEQRRAARLLSNQLRDRFRLDLAMYVAHSQVRTGSTTLSALQEREKTKNPTKLGDNVLLLIKTIVLRRGQYSYDSLARHFLQQTAGARFGDYKMALLKYLLFSMENDGFVNLLLQRLSKRLAELMPERNHDPIDEELIFLTNNRIIEFLTTEDGETPAPLFNLLISQGGPLTLVIVMLKLVLVAPKTRNRLEYCVAKLILHYEEYSKQDCNWFIGFLEVFSVTFAIYVEDVQYNLVHIPPVLTPAEAAKEKATQSRQRNLEDYRIFSQLKAGKAVADKATQVEKRLRRMARDADSNQTAG
jgi:hypothetical protein